MTIKTYQPSESEEYMSSEMTAFFKESILSNAESISQAIESHSAAATQKNEERDQIDQASLETERNFSAISRERELKKLSACKKALIKFSAGDFGFCDGCGDEVGVKRLLINPTLPLCIECADIKEKTARHYVNQ